MVFLVYLFSSNLPGRLAVFYKYCAAFRSRSRHVLGCFRGSAAPPRALGVRVGAGFAFRVVFGFLVYLFSCNLPARLAVFYKYGAIFRDRPRHVLGCFRGSAAPPRFWGCGWGLDFRLLPPQSGLPHWPALHFYTRADIVGGGPLRGLGCFRGSAAPPRVARARAGAGARFAGTAAKYSTLHNFEDRARVA